MGLNLLQRTENASLETDDRGLDAIVAELLRRPDGNAQHLFEALVSKCAPLGFKLAIGKLGDKGLAEDALQDAFEIVFSKLYQLREPRAFKAWFCRIVLHCCQRQFSRETPVEEVSSSVSESVCPSERISLGQVLRWLPSGDREVLLLREVVKLSYEELSEALSVPIGTVRSRLFKARQRALELLKEQGYE